ncbi:chromosome partition protein Smc [Janthinobacterium sp. HH106]|uniref:DNA-binding protein n=1 Tax=Janthinobacterium sp. HH106 TaxID=1537278 RepID=UPI00087433AD|nr:DNA-binding protein [Janthinobacterium sp. HH106]OEZ90496.1 chromosome partition protein Smc [Janthinobacterium sp. HH106]
MARAGLYQSDIKKARDALLAQGRYPSVDAVRVALGNTGSKTTIHKYLKELETEEGSGDGRKAPISDALHDIVVRLAARLHEEADERTSAIESRNAEQERDHAAAVNNYMKELAALQQQLRQAREDGVEEIRTHTQTRSSLQNETILRHTAQQQVADLQERLAENEAHRRSLEEKHAHARDSLEHYRQSVKEQRDQDQRRHEQQTQQLQAELRQQQQAVVLKQEEATRLNQEGAKLVAELSHAKQALYEQQALGRRQDQKIDQLHAEQLHAGDLERQLAAKVTGNEVLLGQVAELEKELGGLKTRFHELELSLAQANARAEASQGISEELRGYLQSLDRPPA